MQHRGPYQLTADRHFIVCEKYSAILDAWVPFAAQVVGIDEQDADAAISEDIYNQWQRKKITVEEPPAPDMEAERERMRITPLQFRRGLRGWGEESWRLVYETVALSDESRDELEYGLAVERNSAAVAELVELFGWTDEQADDFFNYCLTR